MIHRAALLLFLVLTAASGAASSPALPVRLEYLGHSCFAITTPGGQRLVIDPYASGEWPGLDLPSAHADHVLVTHTHWDHDAWRSVRGKPKVTAGPGEVSRKDYAVKGLAGRHADVGGETIGYDNTVYVVETGGIRFCHLGDAAPLSATPGLPRAIGPVDVLLVPVDAEKRVLTYDQVREWVEALSPRVVVPMHYRVPGVSLDRITGIGTVHEWIAGLRDESRPERMPGASVALTLGPGTDGGRLLPPPGARQVWVFTLPREIVDQPAGGIAGKAEAREAMRRGEMAVAEGDIATAMAEFTQAASLDPDDADALQKIGFLHLGGSRPDRALEFLSRAATVAGDSDPRTASLCWLGAGMALDLLGRREEAVAAYRRVLEIGLDDDNQAAQSRRYLESPYRED